MGLPSVWNNDVSIAGITSAVSNTAPPEIEIPMYINSLNGNGATIGSGLGSGNYFVSRNNGSGNTTSSSYSTSPVVLCTLNSAWPSGITGAFEATIGPSNAGYCYGYAALWDITSGGMISASQLSVTSNNYPLVRSSTFTLTPGHQYGITIWATIGGTNGGNGYGMSITDAKLIVFPK